MVPTKSRYPSCRDRGEVFLARWAGSLAGGGERGQRGSDGRRDGQDITRQTRWLLATIPVVALVHGPHVMGQTKGLRLP
jgi:hypothetical protein